ncbi:hypothetical protein F511_34599 [Dorcoceras hygrometricum]|uniref:Uncharacterized protein n=1 Tax=Dorcoceras hygrometricum TaxID=472368 RepID=A0A2Z7AS32_9LAMI|nr:hypothetical protein F511_34599 [Dorcoceras hygrometricum]
MASSLFVNTVHVCFESVLAMDNAEMVAMLESLVYTGLKGFLGCPAVIHEAALLELFEKGSVRDGLVAYSQFIYKSAMASSLFVNTVHVCFESVLAMDNAEMVAMLESLVYTGLKGFLGCPAVIHEAALLELFEKGSVRDGLVVSTVNGVTVEISEQLLAETFELPVEGLTDLSEIPKDIVFDEKFLMIATITCGVRINRMEDVTDEPRVKKTPVKKAASKKRPAVTTAAEPVMKKKRKTKSKSGSSKDKLEILPVAQSACPFAGALGNQAGQSGSSAGRSPHP